MDKQHPAKGKEFGSVLLLKNASYLVIRKGQ